MYSVMIPFYVSFHTNNPYRKEHFAFFNSLYNNSNWGIHKFDELQQGLSCRELAEGFEYFHHTIMGNCYLIHPHFADYTEKEMMEFFVDLFLNVWWDERCMEYQTVISDVRIGYKDRIVKNED